MNILAYGEVMLRLNPPLYKTLMQTETLDMYYTGSGLNVMAGMIQNGFNAELLTVLPDNNLGKAAAAAVRRLGISSEALIFEGNHLGIYMLEMGYANRPSEVTYLNRTESAFNQHLLSDEQMDAALKDVDMLHICGIALSTSEQSRKNALRLAEKAASRHISVCFDFNFRSSLNTDDERAELLAAYKTVLHHAEIVFGSTRDLKELLDISGKTADEVAARFMSEYQVSRFAGTIRGQDKQAKTIKGFLYENGTQFMSAERQVHILDRIGTGDAFAAGILTGLLEQWDGQQTVDYATACGELAHTTLGDSPVLSREFVLDYMASPTDVKR